MAGGEPARALVVRLLDALDEVAGLQKRFEELERQVNRTSRNSSVAPSSDSPLTRQQRRQLARERAKKQLERERREARSQGGQPGHEGSSRPPAEPEQLTAGPFDCVPGRCGCGHRFTGGEERVGDPVGHQQWELPVVVAEVREWAAAARVPRLRQAGAGGAAGGRVVERVRAAVARACRGAGRGLPALAREDRRAARRVLRNRAQHWCGRWDAAARQPRAARPVARAARSDQARRGRACR